MTDRLGEFIGGGIFLDESDRSCMHEPDDLVALRRYAHHNHPHGRELRAYVHADPQAVIVAQSHIEQKYHGQSR